MSRLRNWVFTFNNPGPEGKNFWKQMTLETFPTENAALAAHTARLRVKYIIFQEETSASGTNHLQGYIEMKTAVSLGQMKTLFGQRIRWARRNGSQAQAIAYCCKDDTRVEDGVSGEWGIRKRGTGGTIKECAEAIQGGMDIDEVITEYPGHYLLHGDKINQFALEIMGVRDWEMDIEIFYGPTGTGKSSTAKSENPSAYSVAWPKGGRWWWTNYRAEHTCIMDEFRMDIKLGKMLKLMDRYSMKLEAKGTSFEFLSHKLVITTNIDPKDWYSGVSTIKKEPLARRIREFAKIYDFEEGHAYPNFVKTLRTERFVFNEPVVAYEAGYTTDF